MSIGNWDKAIIYATFIGYTPVIFWFLFSASHPLLRLPTLSDIMGALIYVLLSLSVYLLITIAAWISIGLPLHRIAVKYFRANWSIYIFTPALLSLFTLLIWEKYPAIIILVFGTLQASVFRLSIYPKHP